MDKYTRIENIKWHTEILLSTNYVQKYFEY